MPITPSQSPPRWKVILDVLRQELDQFAFGQVFYSIAQVARRFDVSSITAIRALTELVNEGRIEKIQGKGHIVCSVSEAIFIRLITPTQAIETFLSYDSVVRRLHDGMMAAVPPGVDFQVISETHVKRLFPREGQRCGLLIHRQVSEDTLDFLDEHDLPFVLLDPLENYQGHAHSRVNRKQSGRLATEHLLELGHRRIGWVTGAITQQNFRERLKGYRDALQHAGIPFRWSLIQQTPGGAPGEDEAALLQLLKLRQPPTAIITGDDNRAIHLLDACSRLGISVPDEMSIVGYPNCPESAMTAVPLTVVDARYELVAAKAMKMLLSMCAAAGSEAGARPRRFACDSILVARSSTAPPPELKESDTTDDAAIMSLEASRARRKRSAQNKAEQA